MLETGNQKSKPRTGSNQIEKMVKGEYQIAT